MRKLILVVAMVLVGGGGSYGQVESGSFGVLADSCNESSVFYDQGYCFGYLEAFTQIHVWYFSGGEETRWNCLPEALVGPDEKATVIVSYDIRHPEDRETPSMLGLMRALEEAWPCERRIRVPPVLDVIPGQ